MKDIIQKNGIIIWLPRILGIVFALFISIFSADVFGEHYGFWKTLMAFFMHLIPTFIILLFVILSWNRELIGAIFFSFLGILYILLEWGKFAWQAYVMIAGPMLVLGVLYFAGWNQKRHRLA